MEYDPPDWWPSNMSSATRKFGWVDRDSETYLSVWEHSETSRLYVEYGKW
jgi:hypothetical protein